MKRFITIKFNFEGIHFYPDAPEEVSFLRNPHRHIFYAEVTIQVKHDNRELEFFMVKNKLQKKFAGGYLGSKSCEMMAAEIIYYVVELYGDRKIVCSVSEDLENLSTVVRNESSFC